MKMNKEQEEQGKTILTWLTIATVLEIIFGIAFLIWNTKIALFLLSSQTVLWVLAFLCFWIWLSVVKETKQGD